MVCGLGINTSELPVNDGQAGRLYGIPHGDDATNNDNLKSARGAIQVTVASYPAQRVNAAFHGLRRCRQSSLSSSRRR